MPQMKVEFGKAGVSGSYDVDGARWHKIGWVLSSEKVTVELQGSLNGIDWRGLFGVGNVTGAGWNSWFDGQLLVDPVRYVRFAVMGLEENFPVTVLYIGYPDGVSPEVLEGSTWFGGGGPPEDQDLGKSGDHYLDHNSGNVFVKT